MNLGLSDCNPWSIRVIVENPRFFLASKLSIVTELLSVSLSRDVQDVGVWPGPDQGWQVVLLPPSLGTASLDFGASSRVESCHALGTEGRGSRSGRACRHLIHLIRLEQWFWPHHTLGDLRGVALL